MARLYIFPKKSTQFYTPKQLNDIIVVISTQIEQIESELLILPTSIKAAKQILSKIIEKKNIIANNWWTHQIYLDNENREHELEKMRKRIEAQFCERALKKLRDLPISQEMREQHMKKIVEQLRIAQDWDPQRPVNKKKAFSWQLKGELAEQLFIRVTERKNWFKCMETIKHVKRDLDCVKEAAAAIKVNIERFTSMPYITRQQVKSFNYDIDVVRDTIDLIKLKLNTDCNKLVELVKYADEFSKIDSRGNKKDNLQLKHTTSHLHSVDS